MPAVDEAMRRSLGGGMIATMARNVQTGLGQRDVIHDMTVGAQNFRTALSSWDNCMKFTYCKWPLVAIIIVGGLIVGSIVWCIVRRICCGLACCCSFFSCCKCCGNCMGCCDPPRRRKGYMDDSYQKTGSNEGFNYGYQPQPPMMIPAVAAPAQPAQPALPTLSTLPQYAVFETKRPGGEDSLPVMPTWEDSKQMLVEHEPVEMEPLKKPVPSPSRTPTPTGAPPSAQNLALMAGANGRSTPVGRGPSPSGARGPPYGRPLERARTAPGFGGHDHSDPYSSGPYASGPYAGGDGSNGSSGGAHPYGPGGGYHNNSSMSTGIADQYPRPSAAYGQNGRQTPVRTDDAYGMQDRGYTNGMQYSGGGDRRPGPEFAYGQGYDTGPGYQHDRYQHDRYQHDQGYGMMAPRPSVSRELSSDSARRPLIDGRPLERQYTAPVAPTRAAAQTSPPASPGLVNNSGFDFNSGFSRPQTPRGPLLPGPAGPSKGSSGPSALSRQPTLPQFDEPSSSSTNDDRLGGNNAGYGSYNAYVFDRDELHGA